MFMNKISALILAFSFIFAIQLKAQISEGNVTYAVKMDAASLNDPQAAMLLQATTANLTFKDDKLKFGISMMGMINVQFILDHKAQAGLSLIDMMGQKSSSPLNKEDYKKLVSTLPQGIYTATNETAEYAGYKAKAYTTPPMEEAGQKIGIKFFMAEDLNPKNKNLLKPFLGDVKGFPIAIEINAGETGSFLLYAVDVDKSAINKSTFSLKAPKDYPEKSMEELMKNIPLGQ